MGWCGFFLCHQVSPSSTAAAFSQRRLSALTASQLQVAVLQATILQVAVSLFSTKSGWSFCPPSAASPTCIFNHSINHCILITSGRSYILNQSHHSLLSPQTIQDFQRLNIIRHHPSSLPTSFDRQSYLYASMTVSPFPCTMHAMSDSTHYPSSPRNPWENHGLSPPLSDSALTAANHRHRPCLPVHHRHSSHSHRHGHDRLHQTRFS